MAWLVFLREATWLDGRRVRGYAALLALACLGVLATSYIKAMGPDGTDFLAFWGAGQVTAAGHPELAYDLAMQKTVQTATGAVGWFAFVNPPPFLLFVAPLGLLPFPLAWLVWVALTFGLWAWAAISAFPRLWFLVPVFPGALLAAGHAQTGLLTGALLVAGVSLIDRRPLLAGALLGALIIKPHLALLVPLWLVARGAWNVLATMAASIAGLLALSLALFGTSTFLTYTTTWRASAAILAQAGPDFHLRMASVYAQACLVLPRSAALVAHCALAALAASLAWAGWRRCANDADAGGALMLSATALASPYLFNYDLPFLILPLLFLVARGIEDDFRAWERAVLVALFVAPFATRAAALPLGLNLMPAASLALTLLVRSRCCGRSATI